MTKGFYALLFGFFIITSCSTKLMEAGLNSQLVISDSALNSFQNNLVNFGSQRMQVASTKLLTITNSGIFSATRLKFSFKYSRDFIFTGGTSPGTNGTCQSELPAGASCKIEIAFQPTNSSSLSDVLVVTYSNNAADLSLSMTLTGYGLTNFSLADRQASVAQQADFFTTNISGTTIVHMVYSSDEFCAPYDCGVTNIVYRNSVDNFASRIDLTQNTTYSATYPKIVVKSDSTIVVAYLSNEFNSGFQNVALRTMPIGGTAFSAKTDITSSALHSSANLSVSMANTDLIYLAYDSQEYCDANSCTKRTVAVRTSADNFVSRTDIQTGLSGNSTSPRIMVQPGTTIAHLLFNPSNSLYVGYVKSSDAYVSYSTKQISTYDGSFSAAVKSDGTVFIFYATYGSGPSGTCPSNWEFDLRTSADNFVAVTKFGCEIWGYPGRDVMPAAVVDGSDVIHIAYATNEGNSGSVVAYRSSANNFATASYVSPYGGTITYPAITITAANQKYIAVQTTSSFTYAGLNLYKGVASFTSKMISPPLTGGVSVASDDSGSIWISYLSSDYCQANGCSLLNIATKQLNSNADPIFMTKFSSTSTSIGGFQLVPHPDGQLDLFYDSNEYNASITNIAMRSSADNYVSRTNITTDSSNGSGIGTAILDPLGIIHIAMGFGGDKIGYTTSSNWAGRIQTSAGSSWAPFMAMNAAGDKYAITYGGNEAYGWDAHIRDSSNNFATAYSPPAGQPQAYNSRTAYDASNGDLYYLYVSQEAVSGVNNFVIRKKSDNYVSRTDPFTFSSASTLGSCGIAPVIKTDSAGVIHLLYSSTEQTAGLCNVEYRNSTNWSVKTDISTGKNGSPVGLFIQSNGDKTACFTTAFNLYCLGI